MQCTSRWKNKLSGDSGNGMESSQGKGDTTTIHNNHHKHKKTMRSWPSILQQIFPCTRTDYKSISVEDTNYHYLEPHRRDEQQQQQKLVSSRFDITTTSSCGATLTRRKPLSSEDLDILLSSVPLEEWVIHPYTTIIEED
jgi:hypothetical protein